MSATSYICGTERRRELVRAHATINGIDYVEVDPDDPRQLEVEFLKADGLDQFTSDQFQLLSAHGTVVPRIVEIGQTGRPTRLILTLNGTGGPGRWTLRVTASGGIDLLLSAVDFRFETLAYGDCGARALATPRVPDPAPDIDYLARDYSSFRRLMLDRLRALMPTWTETNPGDLGVTLVELLAWAADRLSYTQDAIATEAYLNTARRRVSVRRHARLVDYPMHDGCNARAWVHVQVSGDVTLPVGTRFLTQTDAPASVLPAEATKRLDEARPEVFESMHAAGLCAAHNRITFYTWADEACCLPAGATRATLQDDAKARLRLRAGDVLIFEEVLGPQTGSPSDADPAKRHAVRLTRVTPSATDTFDAKGRSTGRAPGDFVTDPLTGAGVVEIEWAAADALPFGLCLSATRETTHGGGLLENISVARGNLVLADHGATLEGEALPPPAPAATRYRPALARRPLTHAAPYDHTSAPSAASALAWTPQEAKPALRLQTAQGEWHPRRDLLDSGPRARDFVVEIEADGVATLRFGDERHGQRPVSNEAPVARYRIGNGPQGNVGADAIATVVTEETVVLAVRNPLPARGGTAPESVEEVRRGAPFAFRRQARAVTPDDWAAAAQRDPDVQRATAQVRWTGSWRTIFVAPDRLGRAEAAPEFLARMRTDLERFRLAGTDLRVIAPRYVPLDIAMLFFPQTGFSPGEVESRVRQELGASVLPDGRRGFFHPDEFSFSDPVYLSRLYARVQSVPGVWYTYISVFKRLEGGLDPDYVELRTDLKVDALPMGANEIARCDSDPDFPERGFVRVSALTRQLLLDATHR